MGIYTIFYMFENPRTCRQARNLTTKISKILDLKSSSEKIFSENCRWVPLKSFCEISFSVRQKIVKRQMESSPEHRVICIGSVVFVVPFTFHSVDYCFHLQTFVYVEHNIGRCLKSVFNVFCFFMLVVMVLTISSFFSCRMSLITNYI